MLFNRLGRPDAAHARASCSPASSRSIPAKGRELNAELCQLLVYLRAPSVVEKTLKLLAAAPTQEEQIEYVRDLRILKTGWTLDQRKEYFAWFLKAGELQGRQQPPRILHEHEERRGRDADARGEGSAEADPGSRSPKCKPSPSLRRGRS